MNSTRFEKSGIKTLLQVFILLITGAFFIWKGVIPGWNEIKTDFPNYYISAKVIAQGNNAKRLYDDHWFQQQIDATGIKALGKFSPQPPIASLVMMPIALLNPMDAKRVWLIFSLMMMLGSILLIHKTFPLSILNSSIAILLLGKALSNDIYYGQLYLMITFGMLLSLWLIQVKKMQSIAGVILAIVTILKYFPILLIIYALITKKNKVVVSALVTFLIIGFFQVLFFGWDLTYYYLSSILIPHLSGDLPGQGGFAIAFQSWPSFFNNLFVFHPDMNVTPIINWSMGKACFILIIYSCILTMSGWFIFKIQKSELTDTVKDESFLLILIVSGLALLPASASYHFLFLLIPLAILFKKKIGVFQTIIVGLMITTLFSSYPFRSTENIFMLILSYPRLIAINLTLIIIYMEIRNQLKSAVL